VAVFDHGVASIDPKDAVDLKDAHAHSATWQSGAFGLQDSRRVVRSCPGAINYIIFVRERQQALRMRVG